MNHQQKRNKPRGQITRRSSENLAPFMARPVPLFSSFSSPPSSFPSNLPLYGSVKQPPLLPLPAAQTPPPPPPAPLTIKTRNCTTKHKDQNPPRKEKQPAINKGQDGRRPMKPKGGMQGRRQPSPAWVRSAGSDEEDSQPLLGWDPSDVWVFTLAPPPSSLPLPRFSVRPKLGCNAEAAAGVDASATDSLRRVLRLR